MFRIADCFNSSTLADIKSQLDQDIDASGNPLSEKEFVGLQNTILAMSVVSPSGILPMQCDAIGNGNVINGETCNDLRLGGNENWAVVLQRLYDYCASSTLVAGRAQ